MTTTLATECTRPGCGHTLNWHDAAGGCGWCNCKVFAAPATDTPDSDQAARWARREGLLNLLSRVQRGKTLTPTAGNQLRADVEAEMAIANDAREVADQYKTQRDQAREQLAAALGLIDARPWPDMIDQVRVIRAAATERADLLETARDALSTAGQNGPHGDDWPAIAPAIEALAAERDQARQGEAEAVRAREAAEQRARGLDADLRGTETANTRLHERAEKAERLLGREQRIRRETEDQLAAARKDAADARIRSGRNVADARRNRDAWRNARQRAAVLSAEVTRRAPLLGEYAARAIRAEGDAARARLVLRTHKRALITILGMDPLRDWDDISNAVRGIAKARQAAEQRNADNWTRAERTEATLTAVRALLPDNPRDDKWTDHVTATAVRAALGDPQPATEPEPRLPWMDLLGILEEPADPCAHGCRQAADDVTRLGQELDAEAEERVLPAAYKPPTVHIVTVTPQQVADAVRRVLREDRVQLRDFLR